MFNEYDVRQINIMKDCIKSHQNGDLDIQSLIYKLEDLLNVMETDNQIWRKQFNQFWGELEITYADASYRNLKSVDEAGKNRINEAILGLKLLLENYN